MQTARAKLTEGSVSQHLIAMALPMLGGIFATMAFNLADTFFVGQLGARELAAMSFTFPVIMVLSAVAIGLSAGTSSVIARAIGAGDAARVRRLTSDALLLSFLVTALLATIGVLTIRPVFLLLGAPEDMLPLIARYMRIWYFGIAFFVVPMVGMGAIRATGDTRIPMLIMVSAAVVNVVLDPLLIFGLGPFPRLELEGAAIATVIARMGTFVAGVSVLYFRLHMLEFARHPLHVVVASWRSILHVGLPAAGTNAIIPLCTAVATAMLATYGPDVVAGFGVASRIESLSLIVFYAMSAIIGPFIGQNLTARRYDRILEAIRACGLFAASFGLFLAVCLLIVGRNVAALFNDDLRIIEVASAYLWIVPVSYGAAGVVMTVNAAFNGMGRPLPAVVISLMRMAVVYLPVAWILSTLLGYRGIFAAYCGANVACGIGAYVWFARVVRATAASDVPRGATS